MELRKCTSFDLEVLLWISKETFVDTFEKDNDPNDFQQYVESAFTKKKIEEELQNQDSDFYFIYVEQELAGYFKLNRAKAQTDVNDAKSIELERIYVLKAYQGKQIGRWMLDKAIEISKEQNGIQYLWLGVWERNTKAIRFYERNGFSKFDQHSFYIGKDEQIDWLMRLDF